MVVVVRLWSLYLREPPRNLAREWEWPGWKTPETVGLENARCYFLAARVEIFEVMRQLQN
jgi:hypothetical protein